MWQQIMLLELDALPVEPNMIELRQAWRRVRNAPWYAATVVGVLAIGIALATVSFAVVDGVLFKPLPYSRAPELFLVRGEVTTAPHADARGVGARELGAWSDVAAGTVMTVVGAAPTELERFGGRYWSAEVDDRFFDVMGIRPQAGGFSREDYDWTVAERTTWRPMMISDRLWREHFGADPAVVGRRIVLSERPDRSSGIRIAGILPRDFVFPAGAPQPDAVTPFAREHRRLVTQQYQAILRVGPSTDRIALQERLVGATRRLATDSPVPDRHTAGGRPYISFDDVRLVPLAEHLGRQERGAFRLILAGAAGLLLLACVNVAGLAAARNAERRRELAVHRALGASGARLIGGLLAETGLLVAGATAAALVLVQPLLQQTIALLPPTMSLLKTPAIDVRVFFASVVFSILTVAVVTIWPAHVATRSELPSASLGSRSTRGGRRARRMVVSLQVAIGFVLVVAGGLSLTSAANAWRNDTGFRRDRMVLLEVFSHRYGPSTAAAEQLQAAAEALGQVPGVAEVAVSSIQPMFARVGVPYTTLAPEAAAGSRAPALASRRVTANFFRVMELEIIDGRWPAAGEWDGSPVVMVGRTAARALWPDESAVGHALTTRAGLRHTVIGVVEDARFQAVDADPIGDIYAPDPIARNTTGVYFHVRTLGQAQPLVPALVRALPPDTLHVTQATTHQDALFESMKHRALPAWLFGTVGLGALIVFGAGILGLLAMSASLRTRELGIRAVLGATPARVVGMLVGEQLGSVAIGLGLGGLASGWAVRLVASHLYGVAAYDLRVWTSVAGIVVAVALVGTLVPSVRAARVDPVRALRVE